MIRARGANAILAAAFASTYGGIPASGYRKLAFVSSELGDEQGLLESDLLGQGREPQEATDDVVNNRGALVIPVDVRGIGVWLKALFGAPQTTQGVAASGSYVFSAQPEDASFLTINGQAITFVAADPGANEVLIGATLADTVTNLVLHLNASAEAEIAPASYSADDDLTTLLIVHDTIGVGGNAFTITASTDPDAESNATPSAATLEGGAATGAYNHVFQSGTANLPNLAVEIGMADIGKYFMNYGVVADSLEIPIQRSGLLNATLQLVAQGERAPTGATGAGSPTELAVKRFAMFSSSIKRSGVPVAKVQSGRVRYSNNLDVDESIRGDGRIGGADGGNATVGVNMVVRFTDADPLYAAAVAKETLDISFGWATAQGESLTFRMSRVRLPKSKLPVTGPGGVQATFEGIGSKDLISGKSMTVTLVNDVANYD